MNNLKSVDGRRYTNAKSVTALNRLALVSIFREAKALNERIDQLYEQAQAITGERAEEFTCPLLTFEAIWNAECATPEELADTVLRGLGIEVVNE